MQKQVKKSTCPVWAVIFGAILLISSAASCSKNSNPNADFIGTYYGTAQSNLGPSTDTLVISAGSSSSSVIIYSHASGSAAGLNGGLIEATVNGNTLTIDSQTVTLTAGMAALGGSGVLNNDTSLIITLAATLSTNPGIGVNINYSGTR